MIVGNNDATSIGYGDGKPNNAPQEEPTEEGPNQGVEIQDNPLPVDRHVNFQVSNAIILTMDYVNQDKNVPLIQMLSTVVQKGCLPLTKPLLV
jgi:hypothetical protein